MRLFEPVWKTKNSAKMNEALTSVRKITDIKKLRDVALYAYLPEIQFTAIEQISDPQILREVILANNTSYEIRREAVSRIDDPEILEKIAMQRQAYPADGDAIAMLTDLEQLRRIALSEQGGEQDKAVYKISEQHVLGEIAVNAKKGSARKTAIRCITDPDILLNIMSSAEEVYTRSEAFDRLIQLRKSRIISKLSEEQHQRLIDYIIRESDRNVRIDPEEFSSPEDLSRIYQKAARYDLRAKALGKLVLDPSFPESSIPEAWKTADSNRRTVHNTFSNPWQDAQQKIESRITAMANADPELLLEFIRDPAVGSEYSLNCLKCLFDEKYQERDQIGYLRDKAFAAFLQNIPRYAETDGNIAPEEYLLFLARAIPSEFLDQYGLEVYLEEHDL